MSTIPSKWHTAARAQSRGPPPPLVASSSWAYDSSLKGREETPARKFEDACLQQVCSHREQKRSGNVVFSWLKGSLLLGLRLIDSRTSTVRRA